MNEVDIYFSYLDLFEYKVACYVLKKTFYENSQGQIFELQYIGSISNGYHKKPQLILQYENETVTITKFVRRGTY